MVEETPQRPEIKGTLSRRFARNFASILTSDVLNRGTTFLIYILVARELGAYAFGQMSLALTLFYSFQVIAAFGMQTLITREVAKDTEISGRYLGAGLVVGLVSSLFATLLLVVAVMALNYPVDTRNVILITALGIVPFAVSSTCTAVIRGWEKMHLIALVQVPVNLFKMVATVCLLWWGGNIFHIVAVITLAQFLITVSLLAITLHQLGKWGSLAWDSQCVRSIVTRSMTFVGIDTVTAWWASLNIVLLSKLTSETEAGLYNAASQLMIPMAIFFQSVMVSAFPILCRKYSTAPEGLVRVSNRLIEFLLIVAVPGTVGLCLVAEPALQFVFKDERFVEAAGVVRIMAIILILQAFTFVLGHILWAGSRELTTLRIVTVNLIACFGLGWVLIQNFGIVGAAYAALLTRLLDVIQHYYPVRKMVARIEFGRLVWKPLLASLVMAGYLILFRDEYLPLLILTAVPIYFGVLFAFESWMVGGFRNLAARYF